MGLGGAEEVQASKKDAVALRHMAKKSSSEGGDLTAEQEKKSRMCRSVTGPQAHQLVPGKFQPIAINQASHQTTRNLHQGRNNRVSPSYPRTGGGAHGVSLPETAKMHCTDICTGTIQIPSL